jgi:hypothetical protein
MMMSIQNNEDNKIPLCSSKIRLLLLYQSIWFLYAGSGHVGNKYLAE